MEQSLDNASENRPFSVDQGSQENPIFSYDQYFGSVRPDVAVRIGRETVKKWSHRWLYKEGLPVRYIRYDIVGDSLEFSVTVDYQYFRDRRKIDLIAPAYAPGQIFKPVGERRAYDRDKDGSEFVVDIKFRLRFPLVGYQKPGDRSQDNTLYMQFTRQAIQAYYLEDFETYLMKLEERAELFMSIRDMQISPSGRRLSDLTRTMKELEELDRKLTQNGSLSPSEQRRLESLNVDLKQEDVSSILTDKLLLVDSQIERFQSGSILPFVPSSEAIKELLSALGRNKVFSDYLDIEVHEYQGLAGGIIKMSGLNRIIEARLPGLDIYFVGVDRVAPGKLHMFGSEGSKILVAGRLRK